MRKSNDRALSKTVKTNATCKMPSLGSRRLTLHNTWLSLLGSHSKSWQRVSDQVNSQRWVGRRISKSQQEATKTEITSAGWSSRRLNTLTSVVIVTSSLFAGTNDGGKVIVYPEPYLQHPWCVDTSNALRNTNNKRANGRSIVNAVSPVILHALLPNYQCERAPG